MVAPGPRAEAQSVAALTSAGARFAFVHGSRAEVPGTPAASPRPGSDLDIAAWWGGAAPMTWEIDMPAGVDLLVLDRAPLWLSGRVALWGRLLFVADSGADVERAGAAVRHRLLERDARDLRGFAAVSDSLLTDPTALRAVSTPS